MTSKEFLDRPYHIKKKIRYLELELDRYHTMIYSIPTPSFNAVRVDKSPSKETPNQIGLEKYYETQGGALEKSPKKGFFRGFIIAILPLKKRLKNGTTAITSR